jgi:hypothetical protein
VAVLRIRMNLCCSSQKFVFYMALKLQAMMLEPEYILVTDPEADNGEGSQPRSPSRTHRWLRDVLVKRLVFQQVAGIRTALDAGLLLLPFELRPPIHHTTSRLHRGQPKPCQLQVRHTGCILDVAYRDIRLCPRSFRLRSWGLHPGSSACSPRKASIKDDFPAHGCQLR